MKQPRLKQLRSIIKLFSVVIIIQCVAIDRIYAESRKSKENHFEKVFTHVSLFPRNLYSKVDVIESDLVFNSETMVDVTVSGVVTDQEGQPIPGVTVSIPGTGIGTATDLDGKYSITVPEGSTLVFSFIGFESQSIEINNQTEINVSLSEDIASLDEVVVVGYGSVNRENLTSAVSSLNEEDFVAGTVSPLMAIQGKVPGLSIQSTNGADPNSGVSIQLRGVNSVNASQGPLIVIDGVPGGDINTVVKEDIASIEVLRDASGAAIYGTRASGGVILITTKSAIAGELSVSYTGELFAETVRRYNEPLGRDRFLEQGLGDDLGHNTDWFDEVTNDVPISYRNVISLSGGVEDAKIRATISNRSAKGLAIGAQRDEIQARINTDFNLFDGFLRITNNLSYSERQSEFSNNDIFRMALQLNPTETPYDPTEAHGLNVWTGGYDWYNPVADIRLRTDQRKYSYLLNTTTFLFNLSDNVSLTARYSMNNDDNYGTYWRSAQHKTSLDEGVAGYASHSYGESKDNTFETFLTYDQIFDLHTLNAVGGYSFQEFNGQGFSANNSDFAVDGIEEHDLGTGRFLAEGRAGLGSYKNPRVRLMAFFGRVNYSFDNRYLITASLRREGSSKFAKGNRWGNFPALSIGWNIHNEPFMQWQTWFTNLKFRAGYGETGNEGFAPGVATRMYGPDTWWLMNGEWRRTYGVSHNQNTDLKWETKKEYNIGIDFAILDGNLSGRFDVFQRDVDDLIYDISVPQPPAIHDKTTMNVGVLRNTGWEAELTWNAVDNTNFQYVTTLIGSAYKSELVSLWGNQTFWDRKGFPAPGSPGNAVRLFPGEPIGRFFVWEHAGFTETGDWMLRGSDGEVFDVTERTKTNEDKKFIGNAIPKLILAWNNQFNFGNFDVNAYFRGWSGHDIFNMPNFYYGIPLESRNVLVENFEEQRHITGEKELSNYWIEDGDFLKLDVLSLGYTFNFQGDRGNRHVKGLRVYATGQNLFVLTNYSGLNPEVNINGLDPGFEERATYPQTRTFMLGVQANF
ncbi:SusC/RagA family TonB-linked outer membrane protein [Cyclobacterium sp. GBPx2]|uniref:SusC/RagA family TonB-linked outer membrane protein n=1 Tax=Cyclobacterium plantarum TaxID=2716263 RepID=A0ABX0H5K2_9BACT|nr:SusC/RagA family TonB-linked outer membrane protein [Cyclobacterium plantarum]